MIRVIHVEGLTLATMVIVLRIHDDVDDDDGADDDGKSVVGDSDIACNSFRTS